MASGGSMRSRLYLMRLHTLAGVATGPLSLINGLNALYRLANR